MTEEKQELKLPEELKKLVESRSKIRNDIRDMVLNIVFKVAEISGVYLNLMYILNHLVSARISENIEDFAATLFLDNGMIIEAKITTYSSYIKIDSLIKCECSNICGEKGR